MQNIQNDISNIILELKELQNNVADLITEANRDTRKSTTFLKSVNEYIINSNTKNNIIMRKTLSLLNYIIENQETV